MSTFASTAMPSVSTRPAMPGIVRTLRELSPFGRGEEPDDPGAAR